MDPSFAQGLHALLTQLSSSDTVSIKAATAQLNRDYFKNPTCIPALTQILASAPEESVRQLAAVELRKRVSQKSGELWINVAQPERDQIKQKLPEVIIAEPSKPVRHSGARVIAAIASIELPLQQWPELLPLISRCCTSSQVHERELGIFVLFTVLESIVDGFSEHVQELYSLFEQLLRDPESSDVRVTTVRSLGVLAQYISTEDKREVQLFQQLLPSMIVIIQDRLDSNDETSARQLFDVFETLLILEAPILSKHIPQLVQFFLQCGANRNYDDELRIMALNALLWTVKYKKSKVQSANLAPAILQGMMPITAEPEPDDAEDDAPCRSALRIIDTLSTSLPPSQVFPALRQLIQQYMSQTDPNARRGALLALGVAVEGVSEYMGPHVQAAVWPLIDSGLADADPSVRRAALTAVGCICEWLEDEAAARHTILLPALLSQVSDPSTQRQACTALDAFLEILGDTIKEYLDLLMQTLSGLLDTAPLKVKAVVVGALGSAAHASGTSFLPYFEATIRRLAPFLQLTAEGEEIELRGITMDAIGTFAEAVESEPFRPYFQDMMTQAFAAIETNNARLRECSFLFFGVMSRVFGDEFAPYLDRVVPALINSLKQEESDETDLLNSAEAADAFSTGTGATAQTAISVTEGPKIDVDDAESLDAEKLLEVNSAIAVEKEIAADTIGTIFANTGHHFLPYVEQSAIELVDLLSHYYEGIRKSAAESLLQVVRTFYKLSDPQEWEQGVVLKVPLHQNVKDLINHTIPPLMDMYDTEDDKSVVTTLCAGLAETITTVGPGAVEGLLDRVSELAIQILEQKSLCQQDPDQDEDDEPLEDQAEYESVLISSAGDIVAALAQVFGADFVQAFEKFFPLISKFYKKERSLSERSSAIGSLAEIVSGMKQSITPYTEPLYELFYQALQDEEAEVNSNAAFAMGMLVEHSSVDLSSRYITILAALHPMFSVAPDANSTRFTARDNAVGAVARLITRNPEAVNYQQVLPVFVSALPLQNDFLENQPVFRALLYLFQTAPSLIMPYFDQLLPVFAQVLDPAKPKQLGVDQRQALIELLNALKAEYAGKMQAAGLGAYLTFAIDCFASSRCDTSVPAVRVPLHWSFSVGFNGGTFVNQHELFYYARLANGSLLPDWLTFDGNTVTLDGVARSPSVSEGDRLGLVLIASDQEGYSAVRVPFDLLVFSHELHSIDDGVTLNATVGEEFSVDFGQDAWVFAGIMVDNSTVTTANITSLSVDTSSSSWLSYDPTSQTLIGKAPSTSSQTPLPMTVDGFNQSLLLNSSVIVLPSLFTEATIPQVLADPDADFTLSLSTYLSTNPIFQGHDIDISASSNCSFLNLTSDIDGNYTLSGHIPLNPSISYSDFTFTAYDHTTHAASHASLRVAYRLPSSDAKRSQASAQRRKLVLGLSVSIGSAAGLVALAGLLAVVRKYCRVKDTALDSYCDEKAGGYDHTDRTNDYGWTEKMERTPDQVARNHHSQYPMLGITRTPTLMPGSPPPKRISKGAFFTNVKTAVRNFSSGSSTRKSAISKPMLILTKESEDSLRALRSAAGLEDTGHYQAGLQSQQAYIPGGFASPLVDGQGSDRLSLGSGIRATNTSSTGHSHDTERSIPRQRADFGPAPRDRMLDVTKKPSNAFARMPLLKKSSGRKNGPHSRRRSDATERTQSSGEHDAEIEEAVIMTASRATSMRSARSSSCSNTTSVYNRDSSDCAPTRPRLVQFTSARGVPAPVPTQASLSSAAGPRELRRVSQIAAVVSTGAQNADTDADAIMTEGMRYVRAFGDENVDLERSRVPAPSNAGTVVSRSGSKRSSHTRGGLSPTTTSGSGSPIPTQSSYIYPSPSQSVDSGAPGKKYLEGSSKGSKGSLVMSRIIVRSGEAFVFKYPVLLSTLVDPKTQAGVPHEDRRKLVARLLYNGGALPAFLFHNISSPILSPSSSGKRWRSRFEVEFWGTPSTGDVGDVVIGIFADGEKEECVGRLVVDVVARG